ncbi:polycystin-1-like protein 3 [Kogia breviceps]|uniref:polycystin-1-like protein 3 n=1 Tax=Kogia breviceps TaxID=27615 RepID=UPI0034D1D704
MNGTTTKRHEQAVGIKRNCGIPAQKKYVPTLSVNSLHGVLSYNINQLVKLLSSLVCSYLEGQGPAGRTLLGKCYLLRVLRRLQSHLDTLGPAQAHQPCDVLDAVSQLQELQELLEMWILPIEQGPSRLLLGVTSLLASAFLTALYSLELNEDQATSWVISILSLLQNIFTTSKGDLPHIVLLSAAEQDAVASQRGGTSDQEDLGSLGFFCSQHWHLLELSNMQNLRPHPRNCIVTKFQEILIVDAQQMLMDNYLMQDPLFWPIFEFWTARCLSSFPGSRDENNPIYIAPAMNGPVKCPERTLKEKKFFKLTGDILVQILFLILLMTAVYSAHNSNRFYLRQAIHKSFPYRFSEIKLLKHFYPGASSTLLPNLYSNYRV